MPPDKNRSPSFAGQAIRLGGRKSVAPTCRDEVLAALAALEMRAAGRVFTVREVYAEMVATGTRYAELTVFKTMQRMKVLSTRPPYARLERVGGQGFRLADETSTNRSSTAPPSMPPSRSSTSALRSRRHRRQQPPNTC
jgi:hypothetical protein